MASIFQFTSINHTNSNGIDLLTGDSVYIAAGATVAGGVDGSGHNGLSSSGSGIDAQVLGNVWGHQYGIHFAGTDAQFSNILIGAAGSVIGVTKAGINLAGYGDYINNLGLISGPTGIIMTGNFSTITNSGTITADNGASDITDIAIDMTGDTGDAEVTNSGMIDGELKFGNWYSSVNNSGSISVIFSNTMAVSRVTIQNSGTIGGTDSGGTGYAIWNQQGTGAYDIRNTGTIDGGVSADHSTGGSHIVVGASGDIINEAFATAAVSLGGGNNTIIDHGSISAYGVVPHGITMNGDDGGNLVSISSSGTVSAVQNTAGNDAEAIAIRGGDNIVTNHGSIMAYGGKSEGIALSTVAGAGGHNTIVNTGTITANIAIDVDDGGNSVTNTGTIDSVFFYANGSTDADSIVNHGTILAGTADDAIDGSRSYILTVTNTGHIVGNIEFGDGSGIYDGADGRITGGTVIAGNGDALFTGGDRADSFDVSHAAAYVVAAGAGNDTIAVGTNFLNWRVDGGDGNDTVVLTQGFDTGITITADMIVSVETLKLAQDISFDLTTTDELLAAGQTLRIDDTTSGSANLTFNGSAETDGSFFVIGSGNDDLIQTGSGNDTIQAEFGNDTVSAGGGADTMLFDFAGFTVADKIDGGLGFDTVVLKGNYSGANALKMNATTMVDVEDLKLTNGSLYTVKTASATVAVGQTLVVDASSLTAGSRLNFDGSAETNGHFKFISGGDSDTLTGGSIADTFVYTSAAASTGARADTIKDLDFHADRLDVTGTITAIDAATSASLSKASFDSDLVTATTGHLAVHTAMLVTANGGTLNGDVFLVIDQNGVAGYQSGGDLVIGISGATGTLAIADFI